MFEKRMSYVGAYQALVDRLAEDGVFVLDKTQGWALPKDFNGTWIFVASNLGRRRRLYTLAHEAGHLYCWPRYGTIKRTSTKLRSESRANEFVRRFCKLTVGQDVKHEYKYYRKQLKKRRRYLKKVYGGMELRELS
jgi:Zn-dependent peptidase ImmA (M78 family)